MTVEPVDDRHPSSRPAPEPVDGELSEALARLLVEARTDLEAAERLVRGTVAVARRRGATWEQLAWLLELPVDEVVRRFSEWRA